MEDNNNYYPAETNSDASLTVQEFSAIVHRADNIVNNVAGIVNNVTSTVVELRQVSAQVELECAKLDQAIDALMIKAQRDIRIYEQSIPTLDKQFERLHDRMDKLMDKAMDLLTEDVSENGIAKQEAIMRLVEVTNDSLNSLIQKLIPNY
ncbi:MAG: hypothetical protein J1E63_06020 [Muribaculaceae bacterium]|nr:hypothetical protein [Muribaculaceae bacterium]